MNLGHGDGYPDAVRWSTYACMQSTGCVFSGYLGNINQSCWCSANIDHVSSDDKHGGGYPDDERWSAHACVHSPDSQIPVSLTSLVGAIVDHALFGDD